MPNRKAMIRHSLNGESVAEVAYDSISIGIRILPPQPYIIALLLYEILTQHLRFAFLVMGSATTLKKKKQRDYRKYPFMNWSLVDMKGEKWRDIPSFDGYYCVSNYGRIRALARPIHSISGQQYFTREHIRKQYLGKHLNTYTNDYTEQLTVHLRYERKDYHFHVNRLVYDLFVKPIREKNKKILIVHADGDNCNNRSDNLVPMTGTDLYAHGLNLNRRPRSTRIFQNRKRVESPTSSAPIAVVQYTLDGKKKKEFASVGDAARFTGCHRSSIRSVLKKRAIQLNGFVFRYKGDPYNGNHADFSWEKAVTQYHIDGRRIARYVSVKAAAMKTGIDANSISKCALGKTRIAGSFVWRYDDGAYRGEHKGKITNFARPIVQFSLEGKIIARYASVNEVWRKSGFSPATLLDCAFKRTKVSHGFVWRFEGDPYNGEYSTYRVGKPVTQETREGRRIRTYTTIEAAARATGLTPDNIQKNVKGHNRTAGGFVWRYATEKEIAELPSYLETRKRRPALQGTEIDQYSVDGNKIREYKSLTEAATAVKLSLSNISAVLDKPNRTAAGFVWRKKGKPYHGEIAKNPPANRARQVTQYDKKGSKVAVFQSARQAGRKLGIPSTTIVAVANGKLKTTGGFFWRYGDGPGKINVSDYNPIPNRKRVVKYSLDGKPVAEYPSIAQAAREEGINSVRISDVIHGRSNSAVGHRWKLKE